MRMRKLVAGLWVLAIAFGAIGAADATMVCSKRSGVVVIRPAACKAKEQAVDLSQLGVVGPPGPSGAVGATGPAGPLPATLPSGKTLTGAFAMRGDAAAAGEAVEDGISFPFPLASSPTVHVIAPSDTPPAECPGTSLAPAAMPGQFCIFFGFDSGNISAFSFYSAADGGSSIFTHGAVAAIRAAGAGFYESSGTWAVTAP